jgi:hypothetical protein
MADIAAGPVAPPSDDGGGEVDGCSLMFLMKKEN